jgi:hypothetical protein
LGSAQNLVVWQASFGGPVFAANPADRRATEVAPAAPGQTAPQTDGTWVFWRVYTGDDALLQGKNVQDGATLIVNAAPERISHVVLMPGMVVWVRLIGDTSEVVGHRLESGAAPVVLATTTNQIERIVAQGTRLLWQETAAGTESTLHLFDVTANQEPELIDTGRLMRNIALSDNVLAWTAEQDGRPYLFIERNTGGTEVLISIPNVVQLYGLVADKIIYSQKSTSGVVKLLQRDMIQGGITTLTDNPLYATSDGAATCWTTSTDEQRASRQIFCRDQSSQTTSTIPFTHERISALSLTNGNLMWLESSMPNPSAPRTLYAAPLRELLALEPPAYGDTGAFERLWQRYDQPIVQGRVSRSWTWGPSVIAGMLEETYAEGPNGKRAVVYYDKARMEINDPNADPNGAWYVTGGLLPVELITGRLQTGDTTFEQRQPAQTTAIGDSGQFPTYADLARVFQSPGQVNASDLGKAATGLLNPDGSIGAFNDVANDPNTVLVQGGNGHGVAQAFINFMNQEGLVNDNGRLVNTSLYDASFVFGLPITGAYWVKVRVAGVERPVLFQCFERRCLTYNPANPAAWQVEMGNVGWHYQSWRYGTQR